MSIVALFFFFYRQKIVQTDLLLKTDYLLFTKKYFYFFIPLVLYSLYGTYNNLSLVIYSGYNREGLLNTVSAGYLDMLLPNLFSCLFIVSIIYKYPLRIRLLLFFGVLSSMLFYLSRTNLLFLIYFPIVFLFIFPNQLNNKKTFKFSVLTLLIVIIASYITILQGRGDNIYQVIFKIGETLFRYKSYSFYLAEYAIQISNGIEKSLFPFLGFLSEQIISFGYVVNNPISTSKSEFVFEFRDLGNGYRANVLYPWWSWFYGYYGVLGLVLKAVYIYAILNFTLKFKLSLTFMFLLYNILFVIVVKHPLINAGAFYGFVVLIIFDLLIKVKYGKLFK
jgi:hypothetical protein